MNQIKVFNPDFKTLIGDKVQFVYFENIQAAEKSSPEKEKWQASGTANRSCSYCQVEFDDISKQREHYKLDWHRYNLKQNLLGREALSEVQFNDKSDDISSISGSDTEKEDMLDNIAAAQGKVFVQNSKGQVFSMYKCLLFDKKEQISSNELLQQKLLCCSSATKFCILMLGGGHFAGAIFEGNTAVLHKTFHCYTVRAGQGGTQSSKDSKSGSSQPKSAGASLRRYNEQALIQHVRDIVEAWKPEIDNCSLIIYRASGPYNRAVLFEGKPALLDRSDARLRTVPFSTRRATFAEVTRVHELLTTVQVYENVEHANKCFAKYAETDSKRSKTKTTNINRAKSREIQNRPLPVTVESSDSSSEDEHLLDNLDKLAMSNEELNMHDQEISFGECLQQFDDSLTPEQRKRTPKKKNPKKSKNRKQREREELRRRQIYDAVKTGDLKGLEAQMEKYLQENMLQNEEPTSQEEETKQRILNQGMEDSLKDKFINQVLDERGNDLLHLASLHENEEIVQFLLENGANPCVKNDKQQTPYTITQSKKIREVFKLYAQENPEKYNYNKAQIPVITVPPEELAERKKLQRKVKREKEKEKKKENEIKKKEEMEKDRFLKLSDRDKRALAAERRIINQSGKVILRCFQCGSDISGKVPFEYLENKFCSVNCVKEHRIQRPVTLSS